MDEQFPTHPDRAVQALINDGWTGDWGETLKVSDLTGGVALVLRVFRDDLVMAWQNGDVADLLGAEEWMNARIRELTDRPTITGDTTEDW